MVQYCYIKIKNLKVVLFWSNVVCFSVYVLYFKNIKRYSHRTENSHRTFIGHPFRFHGIKQDNWWLGCYWSIFLLFDWNNFLLIRCGRRSDAVFVGCLLIRLTTTTPWTKEWGHGTNYSEFNGQLTLTANEAANWCCSSDIRDTSPYNENPLPSCL